MTFDKNETERLCRKIMLTESPKDTEILASGLTDFSRDMEGIKSAAFDNNYTAALCTEYRQLREDKAYASSSQSEIILNSSCIKNSCFTIPKVI